MDASALTKVALTPLLVGGASWAGRRFGDAVGGWLIGLPLTSGPIVLFVTLDHGVRFGAGLAEGVLAGALSQIAFGWIYAWAALRSRPAVSLVASVLAFWLSTLVLAPLRPPPILTAAVVLACLVLALRYLPGASPRRSARPSPRLPAWDIPVRILLATGLVLLLTALAPRLGPHLSGLLAPFPLFAAIMVVFVHAVSGLDAGRDVLRGLLLGLFTFVAFFLTLALMLVPAGVTAAFVAALAISALVHAVAFSRLHPECFFQKNP